MLQRGQSYAFLLHVMVLMLVLLGSALGRADTAQAESPIPQANVDARVRARTSAALRQGPGTKYAIHIVLPPNTPVQLIGRDASARWLHVKTLDDKWLGWIQAGTLIVLRLNVRNLPVISATSAAATPVPSALQFSPAGPLVNVDLGKLRAVFERGKQLGNRARAFSKVGDSSVRDQEFLYGFGLNKHTLGPYQYLQATIDFFSIPARDGYANSFVNKSIAAMEAFNVAAAFDSSWTVWTDPNKLCRPEEGPLDCEIRLVRPSVILIKLGLEDMFVLTPEEFRNHMQLIVQHYMAGGVIPVLSTFASNPKETKYPNAGQNAEQLNHVIRGIAAAEQIPLIELREPILKLPDLGLNSEGIHVSDWGGDPYNFNGDQDRWGLTLANLLTLQMLDRLRVEILSR